MKGFPDHRLLAKYGAVCVWSITLHYPSFHLKLYVNDSLWTELMYLYRMSYFNFVLRVSCILLLYRDFIMLLLWQVQGHEAVGRWDLWKCLEGDLQWHQRGCGDKEDEEEVLFVGRVHESERSEGEPASVWMWFDYWQAGMYHVLYWSGCLSCHFQFSDGSFFH